MRRLVIGDVQGCHQELRDLIAAAGLSDDDEIIAVGDIVDRGPDSPAVVDFFRSKGHARVVMGNHERKHVRSFDGAVRPALSQLITRRQFGEDRYANAVSWMRTLPTSIDLPEALVVHAFFEPGVPLVQQRENVIVGVRSGEEYLRRTYGRPWWELYDGSKPIIVGHHDYRGDGKPLVYEDRVYAIDTGCCHGRALTGVLLPSFQTLSVPARRDYWADAQREHADLRLVTTPDEALSWSDVQQLLDAPASRMPSERLDGLRLLLQQGETAAHALQSLIDAEHNRTVASLQANDRWDDLPAEERARCYAARVENSPLKSLLHETRKGLLTPARLRAFLKGPWRAVDIARRVGG